MSVRSILGSLLLTINLLTLNQARSQAIFERGFGTPEDDEAYALCKTNGGGYAVAGYTRFYSPSLISKPFIVKFDQNGQFVWSAYLPVAQNYIATGIAEDASGNLLLCASPGVTSSVDSILVAKLTAGGSVIWSQTYGGTGDRTANEIWVTPAGNILVAGSQMQSSPSKRNAFILNVNSGGTLLSEKVYSSFGNNSFNDLIPTYDGNAVFCSVARNTNDHYAYLVKTDTNGDSLWTRNIFILNNSSSSALEVNAITELSTHELVIGGSRYTGATYNKAFFLQLDETASAIINTAGTGISFSLADGILDMSTGSVLTDEVYGANFYQNFGYHFALLVYDSQNYNVSANFQYLNLSAYSFAFNYSIRGPARAIINDTDAPISLDNNVIAGSTRLSGYGKLDFALVKTDESFSSINNNPPGISYHTTNTICPGDSTLITLDVEKKDFHHWANLKGSGAVFDLGVYGDSLWVYNEGLYACIAFDADSNIFVSNIITITSPDTTVTISQTGSSNFCAAAGGSVLFTATTQITAPAYQWYLNGTPINGATSSTLTATQSGTYYCQVSSGCGISTSNSIAVNANTPPSPGVFMNATIILSSCSGTIGFNQQPNVQYRWYDGSGNMLPYNSPTITPLNPGNYYGVAYNVCGTDSVTFYATQWLYPYPATNSPIINNCNGFPIDLQIQSSFIGIGPTSISWEYNGVPIPGANGINYSATQPGNYSVNFEDPLCPGSINYQYCTIVSPAPIPPFTTTVSNLAICEGDTVDIQAPLIPGVDYQWLLNSVNFNPPDSLHLQTTTPGNYMLTLFNGCTTVYQSNSSILFSDSIFVDIIQPTGCAATCSVPLGGAFSGGTPLFSFLWSTGQTTQNITNLCNGSYTLTVTDGYGCSGTDTYIINQVPLVVDSTVVDPVCGYCNGSVTLSVISGNGPYSFSWGIGGTSQSLNGLCEGNTWSGTVMDSYNCIQSFNGSFTTSCDSVWPGDADDNGIVENLDLFPVGLHYGTTGPVRNNASLLWVGQPAPLWGMFQANGNDLKYADTDGNGTINDNDTLAIGVNFNQTHSPFAPPQSIDPDITAVFSNDTVYTGQPIQIQLMLGSSSNVIQELYGVAYTITYDNPLTQPSGVYLDQDGWLISNNNGLELTQGNSTTANVFASMIRTTQTDTSGSGPLATYGCLAALTLPPGSVNYAIYNFSITDIRIIDHNGNISSLNSLDTSLVITDIPTSLGDVTPLIQGIHPNPSSGEVMISMIESGEVHLTDNAGRILQVYHLDKGMNRIQLSSYANGMYYFQSASGNKPVKVLLTR